MRIYARFVDLSPRGQSITIAGMIFIQTTASPIHAYRYVVEWNPLGAPDCDQPVQECWTFRNWLVAEADEPTDRVTCSGMSFRVDFARNRVVLRVPSSCLQGPKAVRVRLESAQQTSEGTYVDDAFSNQVNVVGQSDLIPAG